MLVACCGIAGALLILALHWAGWLKVYPADVPNSCETAERWRVLNRWGAALLLAVIGIWAGSLWLTNASALLRDLVAATGMSFMLGAAAFIATAAWTRLILFGTSRRYSAEAEHVIRKR